MVVMVLTSCPAGLRGHLTQWLLEVAAGVFVGHVTARVRDRLWTRTVELVKEGRALLVYETNGEQKLSFRVHGHHWEPVDYDGITLMLRPSTGNVVGGGREGRTGWSNASKRRRFGRRVVLGGEVEGGGGVGKGVNENGDGGG